MRLQQSNILNILLFSYDVFDRCIKTILRMSMVTDDEEEMDCNFFFNSSSFALAKLNVK